MNRGAGRGGAPWGGGRGRAWGGGRGQSGPGFSAPGYDVYAPYAGGTPQQEVEFLKNQTVSLEQELAQIRRRLDVLSAQASPSE